MPHMLLMMRSCQVVAQASGVWLREGPGNLQGCRDNCKPEACAWSLDIVETDPTAIPKGLHHLAQGCAPSATLGGRLPKYTPQPCKGCIGTFEHSCSPRPDRRLEAATPSGLWVLPRVRTQGSAPRATLGSVISSFQDWGPRKVSKLQPQACGLRYYLNSHDET
jgi:hypothetical protein